MDIHNYLNDIFEKKCVVDYLSIQYKNIFYWFFLIAVIKTLQNENVYDLPEIELNIFLLLVLKYYK